MAAPCTSTASTALAEQLTGVDSVLARLPAGPITMKCLDCPFAVGFLSCRCYMETLILKADSGLSRHLFLKDARMLKSAMRFNNGAGSRHPPAKNMRKYGCWNRTEIALWYVKLGVRDEKRSSDRREANLETGSERRQAERRHAPQPSPRVNEKHEMNLDE
jgi:hypothetical protein